MKNITCSAAIAVTMAVLGGCGQVDLHWSEEVQLSSGAVILVARTATGDKLGEIGGAGGWEQKEMSVQIESAGQANFTPPIWRTAFVPILLDYDSSRKEWLIVATFYTCQGWYGLGRPALPYVEYRVAEGGQWNVVPLGEELIGRKANLLAGVRSGGEPRLVTVKDKAERDSNAADKYRKIVGRWRTTC